MKTIEAVVTAAEVAVPEVEIVAAAAVFVHPAEEATVEGVGHELAELMTLAVAAVAAVVAA